jgi:8-oxo-dGTP diphosphatase
MTIAAYKAAIRSPLMPGTVTFLLREQEVLLGLKKSGFGAGYYTGIGGKVEEEKDRTSKEQLLLSVAKNGAIREIDEEIGVKVSLEQLQPMGVLRFYFPHVHDERWNQEVYVFIANTWQGEPFPKEDASGVIEIVPQWFKRAKVPYEHMWDDAHYWLPAILEGKSIGAEFVFDAKLKVTDSHISYK